MTRSKLPVPGPWQAAALRAMADLADRLGLPGNAVAVTRAEIAATGGGGDPAKDSTAGSADLDLWLLADGRSYRYRVPLGAPPAGPG